MSDSSGRKTDPLAKLRHDLRTPVNQILGYSELLQEEAEEKGEASFVSDLGKIQMAARQMLDVVDKALAAPAPPPSTGPGSGVWSAAAVAAAIGSGPPGPSAPAAAGGSGPAPLVFREDGPATAGPEA